LLVAAIVGAVIASAAFGVVLYYLARSERLSLRKSAASKSLAAAIPTHLLALDPLLVNLADTDGSTYARLSITLEVEDAITAKESKSSASKNGDSEVAVVRDTALTVVGRQTANALLAPHGKEDLKADLLKAFNQSNTGIKVKKILLTDFLVQR
jgi:flagellar FliL protein